MKFEALPVREAVGHILGHNVADQTGRRRLRKGMIITSEQVSLLETLGRDSVYVARLESDDVDENTAARRIAHRAAGDHIRCSGATTGRVNLYADQLGVVRVDIPCLMQLNGYEGVTLATLSRQISAAEGKMVATLKIIPYALPDRIVLDIENLLSEPLISLDPLVPKKVGLVLSGSPFVEDRVTRTFRSALETRLNRLNASLHRQAFVPLEDETGEHQLAEVLQTMVADRVDLIILAGETAIMDRYDIAPRAVERAGGEIASFGAPVDPGNLLMLAYLGRVPIVGAPGCVRSPKTNIIDLVLPRLLVGEHLGQYEVIAMAHGGLLEDVPERPLPRSAIQ